MSKIFLTQTQRMDGGIDNDIRSTELGKSRIVKNFDILTYPRRLKPYHSSEEGDTSNNNFANFLYANGNLYGLGVISGTGRPEIFNRSTFTDGSWSTPSNNQGALARDTELFVWYTYGGNSYIYGGQTGDIWKFKTDGSSWTDADLSLSHTAIAQGIVHSKDDTLYVPYDNKIAKNLAGSWTAAVLTLPADCVITSICEFGNYLAIGTAPLSSSGRKTSKVYLWDRDASLGTLPEIIDFGAGSLTVLEELEGNLIGISVDSTNALNAKLVIREYSSSGAKIIVRIDTDSVALTLRQAKQKANNSLYFLASMSIDATTYMGVWRIGKNQEGHYALSLDRTPLNDTSVSSLGFGFFLTGDYMFVTYNNGNNSTSKTNDQAVYTATSVEESVINPDMKEEYLLLNKQLLSIGVSFAPLTSGQQVVLKYKVDGGSWTTIFTETTVGQVVTERTKDATGTSFTAGREYQFRVESTGGAEITGRRCKYEILETNI